ncbi:large conductance mechanosensitive channel protein MscL [Promicromonospora sp. NPDC060204]|uniref:large conductance mechanosensitive channel protein MscL n=1 Tax=Promicromonospora sp. NPDC060204 TaxID=3347071 RepID=UPI00365D0311
MRDLFNGFKEFIARGNVIDLAVGIAIGTAFTAVVTGLLDGIINPLIAAVFGQTDISGVGHFVINNAKFSIGEFLQAVLNFLIVAAAIYFLVVLPINKLKSLRKPAQEEAVEEALAEEVVLLTEIRDLLRVQAGASSGARSDNGSN